MMLFEQLDGALCIQISQQDELFIFLILWIPVALLTVGSIIKYLIKKPQRAIILKRILLISQTITLMIGFPASIIAFQTASKKIVDSHSLTECPFITVRNSQATTLGIIGERALALTTVLFVVLFCVGILTRIIREKDLIDEDREAFHAHTHEEMP